MTQTVTSDRSRTCKALMMSCASAALAAAALFPQKAHAQAFVGTPTTQSGSVNYSRSTPGSETLIIGSNTATINWTPTNQQQGGGAIDFLPAGNTATFTSNGTIPDFTVLNRIVPASGQTIALNGHVISTLQEGQPAGGHVWFYAPGGIVVGATAVFDVGGLLLTTNDVTSFGTAANGFNASFNGAPGSTSTIQIQNGAQINALQQNSYVALVAPRIEQGGKVRVNGSAAYVAGEQLSMTMNQGLFDIQVDVGTSDSNGIVHTGETSGPANAAAGDNHTIYMVAVPKNQALEMLLSGGRVGFDNAVSAQVQNGQIILSSGVEHVSGTTFQGTNRVGAIANPSDLSIAGGDFTSSVSALAIGNIEADGGGGTLAFAGDVSLQGVQSARLTAHDEETITIGGNLTLSADDLRYFLGTNASDQVDAHGGYAALLSQSGGSISIAGSAAVTANASPTVNLVTGYGGTSHGGTATVDTTGGPISIGGNLTVSATAFGDGVSSPGIDGRDSWGGDANIFASGGTLQVGGNVNVLAEGDGSYSELEAGGTGGAGHGGNAVISADSGGSINVHGSTFASAIGNGGGVTSSTGGTGGIGGDGFGGVVTISSTNLATLAFGSLELNAHGQGGVGGGGTTGGAGGAGQGGDVSILSGSTVTADAISAFARGIGGDGGSGSSGVGGNGGSGTGGTADLWIDSTGSLTATEYHGSTNGLGGNGGAGSAGRGDGGSGQSGWDSASIDGNATFTTTDPFHGLVVTSYASGGAGNVGGSATAGGSSIDVSGTLTAASHVQASAQAGGGTGDTVGGTADAGTASIDVSGHLTSATLFVGNNATGGSGGTAGGDAYGGSGSLFVDGGAVQVSGAADFGQTAIAGSASNGALGFAAGGSIDIESFDGGSFDAGSLTASTNATGGSGGTGGIIDLFAFGGSISSDSLLLSANGTSTGGLVELASDSGFTGQAGSMQFGSVDASANGGDSGGFIFVASGSGSTVDLGDATLNASGGFGGFIYLLAGSCFDCGGGEGFSAQAAALPAGGGIAATDLTLDTTGNIFAGLSGGADISVSGTLNGDAGQFISLFDDGTGGAIRGNTIDLTAITIDDNASIVGNLVNFTTASDMGVGNVQASQSANFTAGGLAAFNGTISSPTITVTSGDIDVAQGASLGLSGVTNLLTLNAVSNGLPIIIGNGAAAPGQYQLDEDGNIRATSIVFNAVGGAPDVQLFDVNIEGSTTSGGGVTNVTLNTGGSVFVNGLVDFINAGVSDTLTINAGNAIQVNTDTGGIQMTNGAGALAGTLALNASNVWVASGTVLNQLAADVNFAGRNAALGTNSGTDNPQGFVRAGTITASVANSFLVQNSGTPQLFAGIDTGAGGLSITNTGTTPATLIIYGRQTNGTGTLITNQDFVGSVGVGGTGGFTDDSSVNGCAIGSGTSCQITFTIDMSSILGPLDQASDDDDKKKDEDQGDEGDTRVDPSLRLINTTPINLDHTINEPVTSGGDVVVGAGPVQPN